MLLIGISTSDTEEDVKKMSNKIVSLRVFESQNPKSTSEEKYTGKPWSKSLLDDPSLSILSVSQFTLYGTIKKGTKPDFHKAAKGRVAKELYDSFLSQLKVTLGDDNRVQDGKFGEMMDVSLVNEGPVTIVWDTQENSL